MNFYNKYKDNMLKILKFIFISVLIYVFLIILSKYFAPFIIGYILCIILYPIYKFFEKMKIPKFLNSLLCIGIFIFIISFIVVGISGQIIKEAKGFSKEIPYYIKQVKYTFENLHSKFFNLLEILPESFKNLIDNFYENSKFFMGEFLGSEITSTSISFIKKIPNTFVIVLVSIISCFFILIDKKNIDRFLIRQIPEKYLDKFNIVKSNIFGAILGYIKAQIIIMIFISLICFIGFIIIRVPYALFIAVIIGLIDALPFFGSGFILWPWCAYNLIIGDYGMSISLIILYIIIVISRQFLEPKIVGNQIGIHPLVTLMSIYAGLKIFGIFGFIIGPLLTIIIKTLQNENILPNWR